MNDKLKKTYIWWFIHIIAECLLVYVFGYKLDGKFLFTGLVGIVYIIVNLFWLRPKGKMYFINGIILLVSVAMMGILLGGFLNYIYIISMGTAVSVVDVLSFTRYGENTANARIMSNPNALYKLMVYGIGKDGVLYPTYGSGDCFCYALWISGLSESTGEMLIIGLSLLAGSLVNMLIVQKKYMKPYYKGIPATPVPFAFVMIGYIFIRLSSSL